MTVSMKESNEENGPQTETPQRNRERRITVASAQNLRPEDPASNPISAIHILWGPGEISDLSSVE